jgi:hypothetical protein
MVGGDANHSDLPLWASSPTAIMVKSNSIFKNLLSLVLQKMKLLFYSSIHFRQIKNIFFNPAFLKFRT